VRPPTSSGLSPTIVPYLPRSRWRSVLGPATTALLLFSAAAAVLVGVGLGTGWWRVLPVLSPSMRPTFEAGAAVVAVRAPSSSVRAGDILVY
jgi:signal peptidase I